MSEPIELGKEYQTRDGQIAEVIKTDRRGLYSVIALIGDGQLVQTYTSTGCWKTGLQSNLDLIPRPRAHEVKVKLWLVRHPQGHLFATTTWDWTSPLAAKEITVTFTEGEGL